MASVQELIAAAQAEQPFSPAGSVLENFVGGINRQMQSSPLDLAVKLAKFKQLQQEEARKQKRIDNRDRTIKRLEKNKDLYKEVSVGPEGGSTVSFKRKEAFDSLNFDKLITRQVAGGKMSAEEGSRLLGRQVKAEKETPREKAKRERAQKIVDFVNKRRLEGRDVPTDMLETFKEAANYLGIKTKDRNVGSGSWFGSKLQPDVTFGAIPTGVDPALKQKAIELLKANKKAVTEESIKFVIDKGLIK